MDVSCMTLEEKVGQVFMFGFWGKDARDAEYLITDLKAGGIIYFARNLDNLCQARRLSSNLQDAAAAKGAKIPLFIAQDQEGGIVTRLREDLPVMPGPMGLAAAGGADLVEQASFFIGQELRAIGVNMNLAPVLDVNDNPENPVIGIRSFGSDPQQVASLGESAVKGYLRAGIIPVGKHFPGHGNTSVDSHLELPLLPHSLERLNRVELKPFRAAIAAGLPAIMSAHIVFRAIDTDRPATLSYEVLTGLLRRDMGFNGLIMTDCLEMQAIAKNYGVARGAVEAFKAGCDLILISHTQSLQQQAYGSLLHAVRCGEVSVERLDQAVSRILAVKQAMGIPNALDPSQIDWKSLTRFSEAAHANSITLVKGSRILPHRNGGFLLFGGSKELRPDTGILDGTRSPAPVTTLGRELALLGASPVVEIPLSPENQRECEGNGTAVVVTRNACRDTTEAECVRQVVERYPDCILVASWNPYDILCVPETTACLCSYGFHREAMRAVARVLLGMAEPSGRLPVNLGE